MKVRQWSKLPYYDPKSLLIALDKVSDQVAAANLPYNLSSLRTNELNQFRERRQCALFCYGMSQRLGTEVRFAVFEESDTDFIGKYIFLDEVHYVPLQVKEIVPSVVSDAVTLQDEIDKLEKYTDSKDLVVAFHINRVIHVDFAQLDFSRVPVMELWFFGCVDQVKQEWLLFGNVLSEQREPSNFRYPEP
ncbi:MAG: hypothetical protein RLZZ537_187 [Pseudomonadota bacterium]|jgi:hypothetical protein